jgi:hypothetical protein
VFQWRVSENGLGILMRDMVADVVAIIRAAACKQPQTEQKHKGDVSQKHAASLEQFWRKRN